MLQNASSLAIVAVDTEENEPIENEVWWVRRHFLEPSPAVGTVCGQLRQREREESPSSWKPGIGLQN